MSSSTVKDEAQRLVDALSEDATWDDLMVTLYVRQAIDQGIASADAGQLIPISEVRRRIGTRLTAD